MTGADLMTWLGENWCITVLRSRPPLHVDSLTARLGSVVAEPRVWDRSMDRFIDADRDDPSPIGHYLLSQVDDSGCVWVIAEPFGVQAARPEVRALLSEGAETHTLLINENASTYCVVADGDVISSVDVALESDSGGDWRLDALARLRADTGVALDAAWWEGPQWLVRSQPFPQVPPEPPRDTPAARMAAILHSLSTVANILGMAERSEVVTALNAVRRLMQGDDPARGRSARHAERAVRTMNSALWDAFTGGGDLSTLQRGRGRPGAPPMEEDPLWRQMQLGLALEELLAVQMRSRDAAEDKVLLHLRNAVPDSWHELWPASPSD